MRSMLPLAGILVLAAMSADGEAATMNIEITSRESFANGAPFGTAGSYERLTGTAHGEVDPAVQMTGGRE